MERDVAISEGKEVCLPPVKWEVRSIIKEGREL